MSDPHVLHLIGSLDRGGTEHQLVELIRRSPSPERHTVATFSSIGPLAELLPEAPILVGPVGRSVRDLRSDLVARSQLRGLIRDRDIDLVHAHLSTSELIAAACVPSSTPIVASRRGRTIGYEDVTWYRASEGFAHRRVRLMLCNSRELATFTVGHDRNPPAVMVIPNGVDLERFSPSPLPPHPVVVVVANLIAYKRHDLFLHAFELSGVRSQELAPCSWVKGPSAPGSRSSPPSSASRSGWSSEGRSRMSGPTSPMHGSSPSPRRTKAPPTPCSRPWPWAGRGRDRRRRYPGPRAGRGRRVPR